MRKYQDRKLWNAEACQEDERDTLIKEHWQELPKAKELKMNKNKISKFRRMIRLKDTFLVHLQRRERSKGNKEKRGGVSMSDDAILHLKN